MEEILESLWAVCVCLRVCVSEREKKTVPFQNVTQSEYMIVI